MSTSRSVRCHLCCDSYPILVQFVLSLSGEHFHFPVSYHKNNNQTISAYHTTYNKLNSVQCKFPFVPVFLLLLCVLWSFDAYKWSTSCLLQRYFSKQNSSQTSVLTMYSGSITSFRTYFRPLLVNGSKMVIRLINVIVRNLFRSLWLAALEILNKKTGMA